MNALAYEFWRKYNSDAPTDEAFCRNANHSVLGAWNETTAAKTDLPAGAYEWTGESAVGVDGSEVTAWTAWTRMPIAADGAWSRPSKTPQLVEDWAIVLQEEGSISGRATGVALTTTKARTAYDVLIGSLCMAKDKCFTGDIAALAIWDHALTVEEMTAVTEHYAERYSFYPLAKSKFAAADLTERGVAAKEIKVGADATLLLPMSAARPFTLKAGQSLTGEGMVFGSVRWGAGTVLDTGSAARPEDLQLQDATIRFAVGTVPYDGSHITSVSGTITLDVTTVAPTSLPSRLLLITLPKGVVADGMVFRSVGADSFSQAFYDESCGGLILRTSRGLQLLVR